MKIHNVRDKEFAAFGKLLDENIDVSEVLETLEQKTPCPAEGTIYVPSAPELESLPIFGVLRNHVYGGLPIQIGYCNGNNRVLNALEYHRGSEVNIAADDVVLLLADVRDIQDNKLDTSNVMAFLLPKGTGVLLYETTLHYAPCNSTGKEGFRVVIVLPKGTNTEVPEISVQTEEDKTLWARNKWLLAHPDSPEAVQGAYVGLTGENLQVV